jgi:esterase/lipase superfamily enzyme
MKNIIIFLFFLIVLLGMALFETGPFGGQGVVEPSQSATPAGSFGGVQSATKLFNDTVDICVKYSCLPSEEYMFGNCYPVNATKYKAVCVLYTNDRYDVQLSSFNPLKFFFLELKQFLMVML